MRGFLATWTRDLSKSETAVAAAHRTTDDIHLSICQPDARRTSHKDCVLQHWVTTHLLSDLSICQPGPVARRTSHDSFLIDVVLDLSPRCPSHVAHGVFFKFYMVFATRVCDDRCIFLICPAKTRRRRTGVIK